LCQVIQNSRSEEKVLALHENGTVEEIGWNQTVLLVANAQYSVYREKMEQTVPATTLKHDDLFQFPFLDGVTHRVVTVNGDNFLAYAVNENTKGEPVPNWYPTFMPVLPVEE